MNAYALARIPLAGPTDSGGPETLDFLPLSVKEEEGRDDVLIRVEYAELNPVDLHKLRVKLPAGAPPQVVGFGGSGVIERDRQDGSGGVGTRVVFFQDARRAGSYATHIAVDRRLVIGIPKSLTLQEAATVPLAGITAFEALFEKLRIQDADGPSGGKALLVVGAAGGVGSWALQLARRAATKEGKIETIIATASTETGRAWCVAQGADKVIGHDEVGALGGGPAGSVDFVLCLAPPSGFATLAEVLRPFGRVCLVVGGEATKALDMSFVFFKSGSVLTQTVFAKTRCGVYDQGRILQQLVDGLATGELKAPLSPELASLSGADDWQRAFALPARPAKHGHDGQEKEAVLNRLASGHCIGKLVMKVTKRRGEGETTEAAPPPLAQWRRDADVP